MNCISANYRREHRFPPPLPLNINLEFIEFLLLVLLAAFDPENGFVYLVVSLIILI